MIDLFGNRSNEKYTYRTVDWDTWQEGFEIGSVTNGSFELAAFSDLKATCSFDFVGSAPKQDSLVRVYYSFDDDYGEHAEFMIGTFIVYYSTVSYIEDGENVIETGSAECQSVLKVLQDKSYGLPYTIPAGTSLVNHAVSLINEAGIPVNLTEVSSYTSSTEHTFEKTDTLLTIVNWCLTTADFRAVIPDASGMCLLEKYSEPTERTPVAYFANDENSIMYPEVSSENDWQTTPNVVRAYYATENVAVYAIASNVSGSKASLDSRNNRELTLVEEVTELSGDTSSELLESLKSAALKKLINNSSEIEYVTISHPYIPIKANDAISVQYGDKTWTGTVTNISGSLTVGTKCETSMRRFISSDLITTVDGEVLWEVESD